MRGRTKLMFALAVAAFAAAALRFVPAVTVSKDLLDFAGGLGAGLLIGAVVTWAGEREG